MYRGWLMYLFLHFTVTVRQNPRQVKCLSLPLSLSRFSLIIYQQSHFPPYFDRLSLSILHTWWRNWPLVLPQAKGKGGDPQRLFPDYIKWALKIDATGTDRPVSWTNNLSTPSQLYHIDSLYIDLFSDGENGVWFLNCLFDSRHFTHTISYVKRLFH